MSMGCSTGTVLGKSSLRIWGRRLPTRPLTNRPKTLNEDEPFLDFVSGIWHSLYDTNPTDQAIYGFHLASVLHPLRKYRRVGFQQVRYHDHKISADNPETSSVRHNYLTNTDTDSRPIRRPALSFTMESIPSPPTIAFTRYNSGSIMERFR